MKIRKNINLIALNVIYIISLLAIVAPLLMIAQYNYPSADDWSLSVDVHKAMEGAGGFFPVLKAILGNVRYNYFNWEGRYSSVFLASLQPGLWGEKCYGIVTWLMLGILIFSEIFLCRKLLCRHCEGINKWLCIPIAIPPLLLQILYCPSPEESFYWYTGSMNYTFIYGLMIILLTLCTTFGDEKACPKWKSALSCGLCCILAIIVGGNNYATSLSCFLSLLILCVLSFLGNKKAFRRLCLITLLEGAGLLICVTAPANQVRINSNFSGTTNTVPEAIVMSLVRTFTNIYSWTNLKVILMILLILPFVWKAVKDMAFAFRFPGVFTLFSFGIYASQIAATMYVDGTTGGGRMSAILFYSYYIWVTGNVCYWTGWLVKRSSRVQNVLINLYNRVGKYILLYCAVIGLLIVGIIYFIELRETSTYKAYRNWRQGWAQQYAVEWEERLEVLHDENVKEVYFAPLSVRPEMLMYTDLQEEDGYIWVNHACALYYEKDYVHIIPLDDGEN